jgi:hypothetical protein
MTGKTTLEFKKFLLEQKRNELFEQIGSNMLVMESVLDLFSKAVAQVKNSEGVPSGVDVSNLAMMITFLKILGNKDHKAAITKDDVGIDPNNIKEVYDLLDKVKGSGPQDGQVEKVVHAVVTLAPSELHKTQELVGKLKSEDPTERKTGVDYLSKFFGNLQQAMAKMKTVAQAGNSQTTQQAPGKAAPAMESHIVESSEFSFIRRYGDDIETNLKELKKLAPKLKDMPEEKLEALQKSVSKYDKNVFDGILHWAGRRVEPDDIVRFALENERRYGTEPQFVVFAIEDFCRALKKMA